jgi:hypothetical protein
MQMLERIVDSLYASEPPELLYYLTSTDALLKIVPDSALWATDIHYFDDSSELHRAFELFDEEAQALHVLTQGHSPVLGQLSQWLKIGMRKPQGIFAVCFSGKAKRPAQWHGAALRGNSINLGFLGEQVWESCLKQKFWIGKCVYDSGRQRTLARQIVQAILLEATAIGPDQNASPSQSFYGRFEAIAPQLLQAASLFKSMAFEAEEEWRAVSHSALVNPEDHVEFRSGDHTLVPYIKLGLPRNALGGVALENATTGPTPRTGLAISALADFLSRHASSPGMGVYSCDVPYRRS